ncbi:GNAT family N-acetyltransferase [Halobacillus litoralis]|uniref:Lysine N-acyltransferase MbtK n=1 Tax=Halobacillus litoralis TaxID=45668 RepID=A0A845EFD0_9BACI|nr:GNAT family N-acetyltransferase [Halobacillus litoralis]MYL49928.1 GNAT family N-acetyltransferase [Halobacillus litoralis]
MSQTINKTELKMKEGAKEDTFTFRPLEEKDVELLHDWMHQKHISPFWKLNLPMEELRSWVRKSIEAEHKDGYIGTYNGEPVCYLIAYAIEKDPIKDYYDDQNGDLGMHLLIGPRPFLNLDDGLSLVRAMIYFLFERYQAKRIIGEPDRRNRIVIPILKKVGGENLGRIDLHGKQATLIVGAKEAFEKSLRDNDVEIRTLTRMETSKSELVV